MISSYGRGHKIILDGDIWRYEDGKIHYDSRPCSLCDKYPTKEGFDGCIGYVKGATSACCGHGIQKPYVIYEEK